MGNLFAKSQENVTFYVGEKTLPPRFHFKSRYHEDDEYCEAPMYTRTTDIAVN